MLPAARITDMIVSSATMGAPAHIIPPGAATVLIGGLPAARMSDSCGADVIMKGSLTVYIAGLPAARLADITAAGGTIIGPCAPTVLIGG